MIRQRSVLRDRHTNGSSRARPNAFQNALRLTQHFSRAERERHSEHLTGRSAEHNVPCARILGVCADQPQVFKAAVVHRDHADVIVVDRSTDFADVHECVMTTREHRGPGKAHCACWRVTLRGHMRRRASRLDFPERVATDPHNAIAVAPTRRCLLRDALGAPACHRDPHQRLVGAKQNRAAVRREGGIDVPCVCETLGARDGVKFGLVHAAQIQSGGVALDRNDHQLCAIVGQRESSAAHAIQRDTVGEQHVESRGHRYRRFAGGEPHHATCRDECNGRRKGEENARACRCARCS